MNSDAQLQKDIIDELTWDLAVTDEHIGVSVNERIVTLAGHVPTYLGKTTDEKAVQRVTGVKAIAEEVKVRYSGNYSRDGENSARVILSAFNWNVRVPDDRVKVKVSDGWVTLSGEVEWEYLKDAAANAVKSVTGILGVTNSIEIKPKIQFSDIKVIIEQALKRAAEREADRIKVSVEGRKITHSGKVRSYAEFLDARGAAWSAPRVTDVKANLIVTARDSKTGRHSKTRIPSHLWASTESTRVIKI